MSLLSRYLLVVSFLLVACGNSVDPADAVIPEAEVPGTDPPTIAPNWGLKEITRAGIGQNNHPMLLYVASLAGLANRSQPRVFVHSGAIYNKCIEEMKAAGYTFTPATVGEIDAEFLPLAKGYVRVDDALKNTYIAATLAGAHDAVVLTAAIAAKAPYDRLPMLFDVSDTAVYNEKWLADYIEAHRWLFNLTAIVNNQSFPFTMIDFVVANRFPMCSPATSDGVQLARLYRLLQPNSPRYGWGVPMADEKQHVQFAARTNGLYTVPGVNTLGLSVLASRQMEPAAPASGNYSWPTRRNVHYVMLTFSDGDNTAYMLELFTRTTFMSHSRVGEVPVSWMYPTTLRTNMTPLHNWYQHHLPASDCYIASLSGPGYTFPMHHAAVEDYFALTDVLNRACGLDYTVLMDDAADFGGAGASSFRSFMADKIRCIPSAKGFLYMNYYGYARWKGAMFFLGDVPVVSFRYRMSDTDTAIDGPNTLDGIAAAINAASRDVASPDAYSSVVIQVNPGLAYKDVLALREKLAEDVVVVNACQFFDLICNNISH